MPSYIIRLIAPLMSLMHLVSYTYHCPPNHAQLLGRPYRTYILLKQSLGSLTIYSLYMRFKTRAANLDATETVWNFKNNINVHAKFPGWYDSYFGISQNLRFPQNFETCETFLNLRLTNLLSNDYWIDQPLNMHHMDFITVLNGILCTGGGGG